MTPRRVTTRPVEGRDRAWLAWAVSEHWGSDRVVSRGRLTEPVSALPGVIAEMAGERVGYALVRVEGDELEVVAIGTSKEGAGAGTALLRAVGVRARRAGCRRAWLITTNDNVDALRFFQKRGWRLVALHREAVTEARRLKPEIPELGRHGIPIRDELELERLYPQPR